MLFKKNFNMLFSINIIIPPNTNIPFPPKTLNFTPQAIPEFTLYFLLLTFLTIMPKEARNNVRS